MLLSLGFQNVWMNRNTKFQVLLLSHKNKMLGHINTIKNTYFLSFTVLMLYTSLTQLYCFRLLLTFPGNTNLWLERAIKKHNQETIKNALSDIEKGLSLWKAAEKNSLHHSSIYRQLKRGLSMTKPGGQSALSPDDKKMFVERLQICSEWGNPIDSTRLRLLLKTFQTEKGKE